MDMTAILFNDAKPFEQTDNTPSTEDPMWNIVTIVQAVSEKKTFKDYEILYVYIALGKEHVNPGGNFDFNWKDFATLIIIIKFQPLVFNKLWETEFSIFFTYICIGREFDLAVKRSTVNLGS